MHTDQKVLSAGLWQITVAVQTQSIHTAHFLSSIYIKNHRNIESNLLCKLNCYYFRYI